MQAPDADRASPGDLGEIYLRSSAGGQLIGVVILGGLPFATTLTLFIIPVLYSLLARFTVSTAVKGDKLARQILDADTDARKRLSVK